MRPASHAATAEDHDPTAVPRSEGSSASAHRQDLVQRLGAWARTHDPGGWALKRAIRAAVVMPLCFALGHATGNAQTALFSAFGGLAFCVFVEFSESFTDRVRSYLALLAVATLLVTIGTVCSTHPAAAVVVTGFAGFGIFFSGIAGPRTAAATTAVLLTFVLPVAVPAPAGATPARLGGLFIAAGLSVPAVLLWWPRPYRNPLRASIARAAKALADLESAHARGVTDAPAATATRSALADLRKTFDRTPYPATGASRVDVGLTKLIGRTEWAGTNALQPGPLSETEVARGARRIHDSVAGVLSCAVPVIHATPSSAHGAKEAGDSDRRALVDAVNRLRATRTEVREVEVAALTQAAELEETPSRDHTEHPEAAEHASHPERDLLTSLDRLYRAQMLGFAGELIADAAMWTQRTALPAPDPVVRLGRSMPDSSRSYFGTLWKRLQSELHPRSVWFRSALRGGIGLAIAVAIINVIAVQHGFWVLLATMSVLRSSALNTGSTVARALLGSVIGFAVGSAVLVGVGTSPDVLWALLPIAVLLAAVAPSAVSFAAGQAAFTVLVIVLFNIIQPVGWKIGLLRVEDVAIGCAVSLGVGFLLWPRGATGTLTRAASEALSRASDYMAAAITALLRRDEGPGLLTAKAHAHDVADAARLRLDDAFRQYLAEHGAKVVPLPVVSSLVIGVGRILIAAYSLASIDPLEVAGAEPDLPAVGSVATSVQGAFEASHAWFENAAQALSGHKGPGSRTPGDLPSVPRHDTQRLRRAAAGALADAQRHGRNDQVEMSLRMLWACDELDDQQDLQGELRRVARTVVRRTSGRGWL